MEYIDFDLRLTSAADGHRVVVLSPEGETSEPLSLPFGRDELDASLDGLGVVRGVAPAPAQAAVASAGVPSLHEIGGALFSALMPPEVRSLYRMHRRRSKDEGLGLRVRLRIDAPELAVLPWEFLYDEAEGDFLSMSNETPLVRYIENEKSPGRITVQPPLRILGMVASPADRKELDVAREQREMEDAIAHLIEGGMVDLRWLEGETWRDLQAAVRPGKGPWHVFHFIGHGGFDESSGEGLIALTDERDGSAHPLNASKLGQLLGDAQGLRLALLNCCDGARASEANLFSSVGSVLARQGIPAVVSMQFEITDSAALEFGRMFYETIADGLPVDTAVTEARKAISMALDASPEWATPVLYMRATDGVLFEIDVGGAVLPASQSPDPAVAGAAAKGRDHAEPRPEDSARDPRGGMSGGDSRGLSVLASKMRKFWIEGVLENSVQAVGLLDLRMEWMGDAVESPWGQAEPGTGQAAEAGRSILDAFDQQAASLLILGDPGSGKTTVLLRLARDLLDRAESGTGQPVPVVMNLSGYTQRSDMLAWMARELSTKYMVPPALGESWVRENRILPMLDGLDEVRADLRTTAVEEINEYISRSLVGVVVCSRMREYLDTPARLALNAAVRLQPLGRDQIVDSLRRGGERLQVLREVLERDSDLRVQARSPLMLNLMVQAYQGLSAADLESEGVESSRARRKHLLDAYVASCFGRAGVS